MSKFKVREDGSINFRINGVTTNSKFFLEAFEKTDDNGKTTKSFFGDFTVRDQNVDEVTADFEKILDFFETPDNIFSGAYPIFVEDGDYGWKIKVMGRPKFFESLNGRQINDDEIYNYVFDIEVRVSPRKDKNGVNVRVVRAIKSGDRNGYVVDDSLFEDHISNDQDDDDLPF